MAPVFVAVVDPAAVVVLNDEHSDFDWLGFDAAVERVGFGGQRRVLRWIEDEFVHRSPNRHLSIDFVQTPS